jgi:DNA-binding PadR family transcriptional regulator
LAISKPQNLTRAKGRSRTFAHFLQRPQGAPRGVLLFYILHRIAQGPTHGYEISQDIEEKTKGAWRPAPGSIYPMLKKLTNEGLIRASSKSRNSETAQRIYEISAEGSKCLKEGKNMFANAGERWTAMRRIFIDLMEPSQLSWFFTEGAKQTFEMTQELVDTKIMKLSQSDAEYTLKEYALNLERQLDWTRSRLTQFEKKAVAPTQVRPSR